MEVLQKIIDVGFPLLVGGAVGFYFNFASGFSKEFFDERARKRKRKLNVAQDVLSICNEGATGHYVEYPRNIEHVNSVRNNLNGIDEMIGKGMKEFIDAWSKCVTYANEFELEDRHLYLTNKKEYYEDAEKRKDTIVEWANQVRNGK